MPIFINFINKAVEKSFNWSYRNKYLSIGLSIFFFFYMSPDVLVAKIGLENAYALMFFVAVLAGLYV